MTSGLKETRRRNFNISTSTWTFSKAIHLCVYEFRQNGHNEIQRETANIILSEDKPHLTAKPTYPKARTLSAVKVHFTVLQPANNAVCRSELVTSLKLYKLEKGGEKDRCCPVTRKMLLKLLL